MERPFFLGAQRVPGVVGRLETEGESAGLAGRLLGCRGAPYRLGVSPEGWWEKIGRTKLRCSPNPKIRSADLEGSESSCRWYWPEMGTSKSKRADLYARCPVVKASEVAGRTGWVGRRERERGGEEILSLVHGGRSKDGSPGVLRLPGSLVRYGGCIETCPVLPVAARLLPSSFSGACAFEQHAGKKDAGSDRGG